MQQHARWVSVVHQCVQQQPCLHMCGWQALQQPVCHWGNGLFAQVSVLTDCLAVQLWKECKKLRNQLVELRGNIRCAALRILCRLRLLTMYDATMTSARHDIAAPVPTRLQHLMYLSCKRCTVCRVFARVRPLLPEEVAAAAASPVRLVDKDHVQLYSERTGNRFTYELDCVFDPFTVSRCVGRPHDLQTPHHVHGCRCAGAAHMYLLLPACPAGNIRCVWAAHGRAARS